MGRGWYLSLVIFALAVAGSPLPIAVQKRDSINHDSVEAFAETVPDTIEGQLMLRHKPYLEVFNGCVPFPAVDAEGHISGGLSTGGESNEGCESSMGQVYGRAKTFNDTFAVMYSWYMPKDEPRVGHGHRHDWENSVLFLSNATESAEILGISISAHGRYHTHKDVRTSDGGPTIGYISFVFLNHQLISTRKVGGQQPLISWDSMTDAARNAINTEDFGNATPSFRDDNFDTYLNDAFPSYLSDDS